MLDSQIQNMEKIYERVLRPLVWPIILKDIILGFDTEYSKRGIISVQLASEKGTGKIYYPKGRYLTLNEFEQYLRDYTQFSGGVIHLIVFAGAAEASWIKDFFKHFKCTQIGRGFHWTGVVGMFVVFVHDLYNFLPGHLEAVGRNLGFPKLSVDGIGGEKEQYWKENMDKFLELFPKESEEYAIRDSEIAIEAFKQIRNRYLKRGVDALNYPTLTALAFSEFRHCYLTKAAAPWKKIELKRPRFDRKKGWADTKHTEIVFDGSRDVRYSALLSYWGGINCALWRGYRKTQEPFAKFLDVTSLYVAGARLAALPNEITPYEPIRNIDQVYDMVGYVDVDFKFPEKELYPNLPCKSPMYDGLIFPLEGTTHVSTYEVRRALEFGANVKLLKGVGFYPTNNEIKHDLGRFLEKEFAQKNAAPHGSLEYREHKTIMVSLIGKFVYRSEEYDLQELLDVYTHSGMSFQDFSKKMNRYEERVLYRHKEKASGSFAPEWSTLILGKSRNIIAPIVHEGCLHISTDGGIFPIEVVDRIMALDVIRELESVGSGLIPASSDANPEGLIDEAVVIRTRLYGTWYQEVPVHHAMHGVSLPGERAFDELLRINIMNKGPTDETLSYERRRLAKAKDLFLKAKAKRLMESIYERMRIGYSGDGKRFFDPSPLSLTNPFVIDLTTRPPKNVDEVLRWRTIMSSKVLTIEEKVELMLNPDKSLRGRCRVTKEEGRKNVRRWVRKLHDQDYTEREISEKTKMPKSTVHDIVRANKG